MGIDVGIIRLEQAVNECDIAVEAFRRDSFFRAQLVKHLVSLKHRSATPVVDTLGQLVLQAAVVAHEVAAALLVVAEHEVGLARLEYRVDVAAAPVAVELRTVEHGNLRCEAAQGVHVGIDRLLLVGEEVLNGELKGVPALQLLGHVFQPAYDGHGVLPVARVGEAGARVLRGVVGHVAAIHHREHRLAVANLHRARTFLILAHRDLQLVVAVSQQQLGLARLRVHVALPVRPEAAVVDGALVCECYHPVARLRVAPVRGEQLLPALLNGLDAPELEGPVAVALDEVERAGAQRQRLEVEGHVELAVLAGIGFCVEFYAVGLCDGIAAVSRLQVGVAGKPEPVAALGKRDLSRRDVHHRLRVLQLHLCDVEREADGTVAVSVSILRRGLFPHDCFLSCPARRGDEGQHHG